MKHVFFLLVCFCSFCFQSLYTQYQPKNLSQKQRVEAKKWVDDTYNSLSLDDKISQLFIVALYTNKDEIHLQSVRDLVLKEHIGGLIFMQDNAEKEIALTNEFQSQLKIPLLIGMDAEWGLYQRIRTAHKFPWALSLGAIQNNELISEMAAKIAQDCKRLGIHWNFAPVVDVNTNPFNPIIGNRSFGSDVKNVTQKALAYAKGLQDNGILSSIKHFPGHGDTDKDSHLDLPSVTHPLTRLNSVELAPFKALMKKEIAGVMVAHLYVPSLEKGKNIPASISQSIITGVLKKEFNYKGLIITDALNMNAVAARFSPGELDEKAFAAGNDILLFSQAMQDGRARIKKSLETNQIPQSRLEESVKKILLTKAYLKLNEKPTVLLADHINELLNDASHEALSEKLYANALTLLKNDAKILPLNCKETYYHISLEEAQSPIFEQAILLKGTFKKVEENQISNIPMGSKILISLHKDNSTAYKPYKISEKSIALIHQLSEKYSVIVVVFGSPYSIKEIPTTKIKALLVSYENNIPSYKATSKALFGEKPINGKLPVLVNTQWPFGAGINLDKK